MRSTPKKLDILKSALRGFAIIEAVARSSDGKQLSEVSAELGMDKATALRILRTLVAERVLDRDDATRRYRPDGISWSYLVPFLRAPLAFISSVQGILDELSHGAEETAVLVLPTVSRPQKAAGAMHSVSTAVAHYDPARAPETLPLHATAAGKCLLAALTMEELASYMDRPLERMTGETIVSPSRLRKELGRVRRKGYALEAGEDTKNHSAIAVPLNSPRHSVVGGVALTLVGEDAAERRAKDLLPLLQDASERLSGLLAYDSWERHVRQVRAEEPGLPSPWDAADAGFGDGPTPHVRSVARMIRVMAALFRRPKGMSLAELVKERRLNKTTTWRLLRTLEAADAVWQDAPGGRYRVSPLFWIKRAQTLRSSTPLAEAAMSILQDVADATGVTATLAFPHQQESHILSHQYALPPSPVCFHPEHAAPAPLHTTAAGKCYLATLPRVAVEEYVRDGLTGLTERSITSLEELRREIDEVRRKGYALSRGESLRGVGALAVPLLDASGRMVASVVIVPMMNDVTEANVQRWLPVLRDAAGRFSALLVRDWRDRLEETA